MCVHAMPYPCPMPMPHTSHGSRYYLLWAFRINSKLLRNLSRGSAALGGVPGGKGKGKGGPRCDKKEQAQSSKRKEKRDPWMEAERYGTWPVHVSWLSLQGRCMSPRGNPWLTCLTLPCPALHRASFSARLFILSARCYVLYVLYVLILPQPKLRGL